MDKFSDYPTNLTAPAREAATITPNDAIDLAVMPRAIYVGQSGDISVRFSGGQAVLFANAQAGSFLPVRAIGVNATGTTATGLVALW
ncbi:MAG TPA: hypothetical protein PK450_02420 [Paracoccaceae bacterium]|nr:hypothetical protein [Paracoccaceae bacterium]